MSSRPQNAKRIPGLDGLRTISITLVIIDHIQRTRGFPSLLSRYAHHLGDLGALGVRIFFVISGFLITHLLLAERAKKGSISLKNFYARRTIRIIPALAVFLFAMVIAEQLGWVSISGKDWFHALTFTMNYSAEPSFVIGHLWSLSVEEQFYVLWPITFATLGAQRSLPLGTKAWFPDPPALAPLTVIVLAPFVRIILLRTVPSYLPLVGQSFETIADAVASGCVLALLRDRLAENGLYAAIMRSRVFIVLAPFVIFFANLEEIHPLVSLAGESTMNLAIALVIDWTIRNEKSALTRFFDSAPLRFVGVRSYSLYLWQEPFLNHRVATLATTFPWNLLLSFACALASYAFVEQPLVRLRSKFSRN